MCTCVPGAHRAQKRESNSLKVELPMVISHHMDAEN